MLESGTLASCAEGFCLNGRVLGVGSAGVMAAPAAADFDGNGTAEDNGAELAGLVGTPVTLKLDQNGSGWTVVAINGRQY